jgi:glycosyltransferase involved in cell wall biosynthesis
MRILFVSDRRPASFVHADYRILSSCHTVDWMPFRWSVSNLVSLLVRLRRSDLLFGWFASHHTFPAVMAAKILRKRIIIAAADYDLANEPWFNYGSMRGGGRAWVNNRIFHAADMVVVPSKFSLGLALKNTVLKEQPQKLGVIPLGFDDPGSASEAKERMILTVGLVNEEDWIRKGHREFVQVAARFPEVPAYLIGRLADSRLAAHIRSLAIPNLCVTDYLPASDLQNLLWRARVYAQFSYMEGFGASVAEAMLSRCVPVIARQGSLPEVVGDCGYYAEWGNITESCAAVEQALADESLGARARERVLDCFPLEKRRRALLAAADAL